VADNFQSLFRRIRERITSETTLAVLGACKRVAHAIIKPLQRSDGPNKFRLSAMDTATTTHDGNHGWAKRPPAMVECGRCGSEVLQHSARDDIDCPRCVAEYDYTEFSDLELLHLTCPVCKNHMSHGQRHPERLDIVEWATCDACRYHWEFKHSYS
jgi:Zn finger protein HypA/HybF involved in hydrogenase expression